MLTFNFILLIIPFLVLSVILYKRGLLRIFLPYAFLYTLSCAFLSFLILYFLNIKTGYSGRWLLFYLISIVFGLIVLKLFQGISNDPEKIGIPKIDAAIILAALLLIIMSFGFWHYVNPGGTSMYYVWLDVCRYWRDTGFIYPAMPQSNPSDSYLVALSYNPTILSVLQLLTANVEQSNYFHSWGLLTGLFHVFLFLTLVACSYHVFKSYAVGAITFFLLFLGKYGGDNLLGLNMIIGSHESSTFYGAALLFYSWLLFLKEKKFFFLSMFLWCSLALFSIRPYLAAFIGSLGLHVCIVMLRDNKIKLKRMISDNKNIILLCFGFILGIVPFIWQIYMFLKYGSLFVYSHNVMLGGFSDYVIKGIGLLERFQTFIDQAVMLFPFHSGVRFTLMPMLVFLLLLISLLGWLFRNLRMRGHYQRWIRHMAVLIFIFVAISLIINVDHWKIIAAWSIVLYFIAASFMLIVFHESPLAHICSRVFSVLLIGYFAIAAGGVFRYVLWPNAENYKSEKERDDGYRNKISNLTKKTGGDIIILRLEPGADANFEVPHKYFWNLRYFWNDCEPIMENLKWDPNEVAYELRKNNIRWIYQPENWNMDNHAGRPALMRLKAMLDRGKDIYVPVLKDTPGRTDLAFYEIVLPNEKLERESVE